jgi:hypothetical protein
MQVRPSDDPVFPESPIIDLFLPKSVALGNISISNV